MVMPFSLTEAARVLATKEAKSSHAREKHVRACLHGDELWQRIRPECTVLPRDGHSARRVRRTWAACQRIDVVIQSSEARVVAPRLLDELELTLQAGVHAEEMHAARLAIVLQVRQRVEEAGIRRLLQQAWIEERRSVGASAPEQPMRLGHAQ